MSDFGRMEVRAAASHPTTTIIKPNNKAKEPRHKHVGSPPWLQFFRTCGQTVPGYKWDRDLNKGPLLREKIGLYPALMEDAKSVDGGAPPSWFERSCLCRRSVSPTPSLVLIWVHGYLGNSSTFGNFPHELSSSFKAVSLFVEYSFTGSFSDAVAQVHEEIEECVDGLHPNVDVVVCAHSMGGLVVAELLKRKELHPTVRAVCLYDVPFGGVSSEYIEMVGNTSVSEALGHVLPGSMRHNAETMYKIMKLLGSIASDFASTSDTEARARAFSLHEQETQHGGGASGLQRQRSSSISEMKGSDIVDAKEKIASLLRETEAEREETVSAEEQQCKDVDQEECMDMLTSGPLRPLMKHYSLYLTPLLAEHSRFIHTMFDAEQLAGWRSVMEAVHTQEQVTVLHMRVAQAQEGLDCFHYLALPETASWKNSSIDLKVTTNPFAPLMAHTSLFSNHTSEVWHETFWFMKYHLELEEQRRRPWIVRCLPSTSSASLVLVVVCVLLRVALILFSQY
jgi:pimeloyl-ACP methyl ester carboxylesterase